jgi:molecular chaperone GrpE (heat shock protein)
MPESAHQSGVDDRGRLPRCEFTVPKIVEEAPVTPELDSAENLPASAAAGELDGLDFPRADGPGGAGPAAPPAGAQDTGPGAGGPSPDAEIAAAVRQLASSAERYHERAQQREGVIDYLRSELELLRRGERRGLLRPLLTQMCRLHADLVRQAATLPPDFDAAKAVRLLQSYAETLGEALEDNGVVTYQPDEGEPFNPRRHRQVKRQPSIDAALAGHVAAVRQPGYLDIEADSPLAPAEVTVFMGTKEEQ